MITGHRRGLSMTDVLAAAVAGVMVAGFGLPLVTTADCDSKKATSMSNLQQLAQAHASYAADWNDRQFTLARDDLGVFGGDCEAYNEGAGCHPPVILGDDCRGVTRGFFFGCDERGGSCASFGLVKPIDFSGPLAGLGSFRLPNARGFHEYVNGRFFDPIFFAPKDTVVLDVVKPLLDVPCEYAATDESLALASSYVLSPAAMLHPDVLRGPTRGGFRSPDDFDEGYVSPAVSQAKYPSQKTRMLEHHWLQIPEEPCNPAFDEGSVGVCEPYYFNHDLRSRPVTLFFDGHVTGLSVQESMQADEKLWNDSNQGVWSRDTPFGQDGYFGDVGFGFFQSSFHILTTDGIRGRDTIFGGRD